MVKMINGGGRFQKKKSPFLDFGQLEPTAVMLDVCPRIDGL